MKNILTVAVSVVLLLLAFLFIPKTQVNYDMTKYLPSDSNTHLGIEILEAEFGSESMIEIMVVGIAPEALIAINLELSEIEHVSNVVWLDDYVDLQMVPIEFIDPSILNQFYVEGDALITILLDIDAYDVAIDELIPQIEDVFADYTIHMRGEALENREARMIASQETVKIMILIIPILLLLLLLSSHAWIEPLLIVITLGLAVLFNVVTNGLLPNVSFITQTMSLALQVALSIDYALFLIHRYYEERLMHDAKASSKLAFVHAVRPITISALTTIAGFAALIFMRFTIGLDIALVLSKGILFSYLMTITVLPVLLQWFDPLIMKTRHKVFFPTFRPLVKFQIKAKYFLFALLIGLMIFGYIVQTKTEFLYGQNISTDESSLVNSDRATIDETFGANHQWVIIVPNDDVLGEVALVASLQGHDAIDAVNALVLQADPSVPRSLLPAGLVSYYVGERYSRIMVKTSLYEENEALFTVTEEINALVSTHYDEYYLIGQAQAISDIRLSIEDQGIWIMLLTILAVGLIVGLIFRSYKIPLILIGIILSAIWLNMSLLVIEGVQILYIGYLIVMSIQLGATIDYAVLLTDRYLEERKIHDKKEAMSIAFTKSSVSIMISGIILTIVGFVEGWFSKIDAVIKIGNLLGRGAFISLFMILFFLPAVLLVFDRFIIKKPPVEN
jgi:uncharacterized protein